MAAKLLQEVAQYLSVKSKQASVLLAFQERLWKCRRARDSAGRLLTLSKRELEIRQAIHSQLKRLNARGSKVASWRYPAEKILVSRPGKRRNISTEYLAGFIDAEGCLMIARSKDRRYPRPQYRARVCVSNTNRAILEDVQRAYGGILVNQAARKAGWKTAYQLVWGDRMEEQVLPLVVPHLRLKREQAMVILRLIRHKKRTRQGRDKNGFAPFSDEVMAFREALYKQMRELNAKGPALGEGPQRPSQTSVPAGCVVWPMAVRTR